MAILIALIAVTLYAIGITAKYLNSREYAEGLEHMLRVQSSSVERYMANVKEQIALLKESRKELNDVIFRKDKEIKRQLEINSKLMERVKRVTP